MESEEQAAGRRVLVCGGRDYQHWRAVADTLRRLHEGSPISLIIHGCDQGGATLAVRWAVLAGVPTSGFDADVQSHGPAAERLRNERMIVEGKPDLVIAFPGGEETADLTSRATAAGVPVEQGEEGRPMEARDIMSHPVVTVVPDTTVAELARIMVERRISAVPVMDGESMVGIVTEGDLLRRAEINSEHRRSRWAELITANWNLAAEYTKEHGRKAHDVMTRPVITIAATATLRETADLLESRHIKRVPVVENGRLVGIVSRTNLVQALATSGASLQTSTTVPDRAIRAKLCSALSEQPWSFSPTDANVVVDQGEVHLWGYIGTESARRAIVVTAENIPGVRRVYDHMEYPPVRPPLLP